MYSQWKFPTATLNKPMLAVTHLIRAPHQVDFYYF